MFNYVLEIKTTYCDSEYSNHIGYNSSTMDKMGVVLPMKEEEK